METFGRNPYMDYRDSVPFMDLSGFIKDRTIEIEHHPAHSLKAYLLKKKCSAMINMRRLKYKAMCDIYRMKGASELGR